MNKAEILQIRDEIIEGVLPHVPFDGWDWDVVVRAGEEQGHSENTVRAVFPGRMVDVLDGFADLADRRMLEALAAVDPGDLRVRERVRAALIARYEWLLPHKDALRQSLQFWMFPTRKARAVKITWRLADRIWDWAGDPLSPSGLQRDMARQARDYNHYTKRGLLSGVIVSTTLCYMNDVSDDFENTKAFLDRRIENVMQLGKVVGKFKRAS